MSKDKDEIATAHISRGQFAMHATRAIDGLLEAVDILVAQDPINVNDLILAEKRQKKVEEKFEKFSNSIIRCHVLEDITDEEAEDDDYVVQEARMSDRILDAGIKIEALRQRVEDEKVAEAAQNANQGQNHNQGAGVPHVAGAPRSSSDLKPEKLKESTNIVDYKNWKKKVEDYFTVARITTLPILDQRAHLRVLMDTRMDNMLRLLLDVQDDATVAAALTALETHIKGEINLMDAFHP